jgi:dimethylargininase
MGTDSRKPERERLKTVLTKYRPLVQMNEASKLEGGDVLRIGKKLFVGLSQRTNQEGIEELRSIVKPYGYEVIVGEARGCLHFKTGCSWLGGSRILVSPEWVSPSVFSDFQIIEVHPDEKFAANSLFAQDRLLYSASFPRTLQRIRALGIDVTTVNISELEKAEAGVTCLSLIFTDPY